MIGKTSNGLRYLSGVLAVLLATGCTTAKPLGDNLSPEQIQQKVNLGDQVILYTKNAEKHRIKVESIDSRGIWNDGRLFKYPEIQSIDLKEHSTFKSAITFGTGYVVVGAVTTIIFFGVAFGVLL